MPKKNLVMIDGIQALLMRKSNCVLETTDGNNPHRSFEEIDSFFLAEGPERTYHEIIR